MTPPIRSLLTGRRGATGAAPSPPLTSLVDMMTILVVFLLVNFSVEGDLITPAAGVRLPASTSRQQARPQLGVEVSERGVSVDGVTVATLSELQAEDEMTIDPLAAALASRIAAADTLPALTIQCDRQIEFQILKRVVHTCSRAGARSFELLVRREES